MKTLRKSLAFVSDGSRNYCSDSPTKQSGHKPKIGRSCVATTRQVTDVNVMERSLVIIKPDGTVRRNVGAHVLKALMDRGYHVKAFKEMKVSESFARLHYDVHKEKPFFPWLVQFISSAPVLAMILEADDVIQGVRDALGATFVQKAKREQATAWRDNKGGKLPPSQAACGSGLALSKLPLEQQAANEAAHRA